LKRRDLIKYLRKNGCEFLREGSRHTVYVNRLKKKTSTIPRHNEVDDFLVLKICKDLEIPPP
jgi:predicted RNA binding protein YcfA (HicA-like mRNA interferase family)